MMSRWKKTNSIWILSLESKLWLSQANLDDRMHFARQSSIVLLKVSSAFFAVETNALEINSLTEN